MLRLVTRRTSATSKQRFQYLPMFFLCLKIAPAVSVHKVKWDVNAPNFSGAMVEHESSSQSQVLLMASLCCVEARLLEADREEHLSPARTRAAVALSVKERSWNVAGRYGRLRPTDRQGSTWAVRERVYICLWESRVDAMAIFSLVHRVPLSCVATFLEKCEGIRARG